MDIKINNRKWKVKRVSPNNPNLICEDVKLCGITNFMESTIYINEDLSDDLTKDTLAHELAHAFIFVYGHPQYETYNEENICDMFGAFGIELSNIAIDILTKWGIY